MIKHKNRNHPKKLTADRRRRKIRRNKLVQQDFSFKNPFVGM